MSENVNRPASLAPPSRALPFVDRERPRFAVEIRIDRGNDGAWWWRIQRGDRRRAGRTPSLLASLAEIYLEITGQILRGACNRSFDRAMRRERATRERRP